MRRLTSLLRSRRGESMVEILVSMVLFLLVMAVLSGAIRFAAGAQRKAEAIRQNAETVQQNLRSGGYTAASEGTQEFAFNAVSKDESQVGAEVFTVTVKCEALTVEGEDGQSATIRVFRPGEVGGTP